MPSAEQQLTSSIAALGVAHTVWPSCHRNSRVLRNGWGCLNSHLCTQQKTASNTDENDHDNQYATSGYCMHITNRVSSLYEANFQFMHLLQKINNKVLLYLCATGSKLQWLLASEIHDVCAQLTTTLHHWLRRRGRSRCDLIHLAYAGYITVSLVGRMAIGSASSDCPDLVTQATCPNNPRHHYLQQLLLIPWGFLSTLHSPTQVKTKTTTKLCCSVYLNKTHERTTDNCNHIYSCIHSPADYVIVK